MTYALHMLVYLCIYSVAVLGLNFVVGSCGRLSLAQASFFAVGAYAYAIARLAFTLNFASAAAMAVIVAAVASLPLALLAWRYRGDLFVLVSIAVQVLLNSIATNWFSTEKPLGSMANMTNGPFGILGIPAPSVPGLEAHSPLALVFVAAPCLLVTVLLCAGVLRSPWGRALRALRDDELAARGLGKNVRRLLIESFALCGALAGLAGALYASYVGYIDPTIATLDQSVALLSMLIIGGMGNVLGPILGAALFLLLPEILRILPIGITAAANGRAIIFGILLVLVIQMRPRGAAGKHAL